MPFASVLLEEPMLKLQTISCMADEQQCNTEAREKLMLGNEQLLLCLSSFCVSAYSTQALAAHSGVKSAKYQPVRCHNRAHPFAHTVTAQLR